ncbi:VWA domain-containing protein [Gordonia sp. (in: high G+C Gram-positive bacteria)]|uniref:vWA domain-containing protein n=1 Tax=Gordonia sp. (in: high G+C Gram-positive bacteria) TaxID=84139 RepID=UPI0019A14229|nr:VWA domain-containing protein [Gordonia sp. (in: high G+C Gram-positive bacteria)]MBD0021056.1 VWA domain-containing protein [Gordonia sp. (in: high G+C Gram-positive bacteria)]
MSDFALSRGQNTALTGPRPLTVQVRGRIRLDVLAFVLGDDEKVSGDADFVFYNQPAHPSGAVTLDDRGVVVVDPARLPGGASRVHIGVVAEHQTLGDARIEVVLAQDGRTVTAPGEGLTVETSAVLIEIYRRGDDWKIRNTSAGWEGGFADLVRSHGVQVDDEPVPGQSGAAGPRTAPGEEKLSLTKRATLDLRKKQVHKVLLEKKVQPGVRARVVMAIDKTFSMSVLYRDGVVGELVERMIPVATQLDDDGALEAYVYAVRCAKLPDITVDRAEEWVREYVHLRGAHGGVDYDRLGGRNEELPILEQVIADCRESADPVLVLFFTDGGFARGRKAIQKLISEAAALPIFWQFIGIGKADFGALTALDELSGRIVDNAGFFAVDDVSRISDEQLYRLLLSEFPDWLAAARAARVLR